MNSGNSYDHSSSQYGVAFLTQCRCPGVEGVKGLTGELMVKEKDGEGYQMPAVTANGITIFYEDYGKKEDPPLVLIIGLPSALPYPGQSRRRCKTASSSRGWGTTCPRR